jgi:hypothetical protein
MQFGLQRLHADGRRTLRPGFCPVFVGQAPSPDSGPPGDKFCAKSLERPPYLAFRLNERPFEIFLESDIFPLYNGVH